MVRRKMTRTTIPWTDEEVAELRRRHGEGEEPKYIARIMGRSWDAVRAKMRELGLRRHEKHWQPVMISVRLDHELDMELRRKADALKMHKQDLIRKLLWRGVGKSYRWPR